MPLLQFFPDLQRRQMRSPDHSLWNGALQTRHGLVLDADFDFALWVIGTLDAAVLASVSPYVRRNEWRTNKGRLCD
jgi:hypothetical protein